MSEITLILCIAIAGYVTGWWLNKRKLTKEQVDRGKKLYDIAKAAYDEGKHMEAFYLLAEASGLYRHPQIFNLMGHAAEKLGHHDIEARCFGNAHREVFWGPFRYRRDEYLQDITFFYYREARAYAKANDWEFAFLRSNEALAMIRTGRIPPFVGERNFEEELVAVRMVAGFHYLRGAEAFEGSKTDALWLKEHATIPLLVRLGEGLLVAGDVVNALSLDLIAQDWKQHLSNN